jgi:hypothetical protein
MATQFFYLEGTVNWAKVQEPVLKYQSKTEYEYSLDFEPDEDSLAAFKASGSRKNVKNGSIKFNRDVEYTNAKGETVDAGKPTVLIRNEDGENEPYTGLIGNGSKAIVKISVYDTRMGKGTRLEGLTVLDLVPFDGATIPTEPITSSDGSQVLPF